ncbi:unnamed protein product [Heligmosomoides polygyrus]|uniref:Uncharacterized protein n=1 Tax=Heligmosomoides polygyrus TaxID=6339 RepID=A0A183FPY4_HELPZ|nr:unnamed protein product [Heligmosomoides polygyrus]
MLSLLYIPYGFEMFSPWDPCSNLPNDAYATESTVGKWEPRTGPANEFTGESIFATIEVFPLKMGILAINDHWRFPEARRPLSVCPRGVFHIRTVIGVESEEELCRGGTYKTASE